MIDGEPREKKRGAPATLGLGLMAGLLGGVMGFAIAWAVLGASGGTSEPQAAAPDDAATVDELTRRVEQLQAALDSAQRDREQAAEPSADVREVEGLRADLSAALEREREAVAAQSVADAALSVAEAELAHASEEQAGLREELHAYRNRTAEETATLEELQDAYDSLDRHRLLLLELRREAPADREESLAYWSNVRRVAADANPALVSQADKVLIRIDNYYTWKGAEAKAAESVDEYQDWKDAYTTSGAVGYDEAKLSFNRQALLSVVNRLDTLLSLLDAP